MTLDRLGRWQMPVIAALAVFVALAVTAAILLVGSIPDAVDHSPTASVSASPSTSESLDDTPESAVRAFFEAFAEARETSDPSLIEPYVNGTDSDAYRTAAGFLEGQRQSPSTRTVAHFSSSSVLVAWSSSTLGTGCRVVPAVDRRRTASWPAGQKVA